MITLATLLRLDRKRVASAFLVAEGASRDLRSVETGCVELVCFLHPGFGILGKNLWEFLRLIRFLSFV